MRSPIAGRARFAIAAVVARLPGQRDQATGLSLPPVALRAGGRHFRHNADFLTSATREVNELVRLGALGPTSRVLDVGCGAGRLAFGLIARYGDSVSYQGIDVMAQPVDWCRRHITTSHPGFVFSRIDVSNDRYNPSGATSASSSTLPFAPGQFDLVYSYSVLSHMRGVDVAAYLREFRRLTAPSGMVVLTAFVESDVEDEVVNPPGYGQITWSGELHCVRFSLEQFEAFVRGADLRIDHLDHGTETDGQSRIVLGHRAP